MIKKYEIKTTQRKVLNLIIKNPGLSRADIAKIFKLNKSTASYITKDLEKQKLITFVKGKNANGRQGTYIYFNYKYEKVLFIEYSKRYIKSFICYLNGHIIESYVMPIDDHFEQQKYLNEHLNKIKTEYPEVENCILAIHGIIDSKKKVNSPFYEFTIAYMENIFNNNDIAVYIENESNIYSLGFSSNKLEDVSINIQIKDGVGCGIIFKNKLFRGFNQTAGEIGHTIAIQNGKKCNCGNNGCLELYVSDTNVLNECIHKTSQNITRKNFLKYYNKYEVIQLIIQNNIILLANTINNIYVTLNPSTINITSEIYSKVPNISKLLESNLKNNLLDKPKINVYDYDVNILLTGFYRFYMSLVI